MDGEGFFDGLYGQFHVHFPCHAVILGGGQGFATEPADDGTEALVLFTDDDLVERHLAARDTGGAFSVALNTPEALAALLGRLPPSVTHVTFDPTARIHRRYPLGVIRGSLAAPAKKAA
jgi:hypothetical protein